MTPDTEERCQPTGLNRFVPQEQMRTYYRGRGCINASWPTWPQAVWSSSESPLTESGTAVCLYGLLFGAELPVCHFLWDTELCGYEGQKVWLLLALSTRLWHVGCGRGCARTSVCMLVGILTLALSVCVCVHVRQFGWICRRSVSCGCYHGGLRTNRSLSEAPQAKLRP